MGQSRSEGRSSLRMAWAAALRVAALLLIVPAPVLARDTAPAPPSAPVRFAPERDYGPFVFQNAAGGIEGLSVDMLKLVARYGRIELTMLEARSLSENLALARAGKVDLLSSLRPTPERAEFLAFSRPYVEVPAILVLRKDDAALTLDDLDARKVAVGKDYAVEDYVRQRYPRVLWTPAQDDAQALFWLRAGKVDAVVADAASVHHLRVAADAGRLALGDEIGFRYALSFAVRKQDSALLERIEHGLALVSPRDRIALTARWLPASIDQAGPRRQRGWWLGLGLMASGLVVGLVHVLRHKRVQT